VALMIGGVAHRDVTPRQVRVEHLLADTAPVLFRPLLLLVARHCIGLLP
jgi:hypothetical protein